MNRGNMRQPLIIANWKANLSPGEEVERARSIAQIAVERGLSAFNGIDIPTLAIAPSAVGLVPVASLLQREFGSLAIGVAAQDCSAEGIGAHTGELVATNLVGIAASVIIGHSERRAAGDTDNSIGRKIAHAAAAGLRPILCVGDATQSAAIEARVPMVVAQFGRATMQAAAAGWPLDRLVGAGLIVAYEPLWAIGSHTPATPMDAMAVARGIRAAVHGHAIPVLYGGSVDAGNAATWFDETRAEADGALNGLLVGGASLDPRELLDIVGAATMPRR
ncbi:MAG: triose-phosphate isomerase family protein [Candidatus Limnocylindrus sp.]